MQVPRCRRWLWLCFTQWVWVHTVGVRWLGRESRGCLWLVLGLAVVVGLVVGTWRLLVKDSTAKGADIAAVLGLPLTVLSLLAGVVAVVVSTRLATASGEGLLSAAQRLAGDVRKQEDAALARLVADTGEPQPADVTFAQPGLLYWRTDGGEGRGSLAQIASYYRGLGRGRLVVLGEAGSGKTVLAIALVRDLSAAIVGMAPSSAGRGRVVVPVRLSLPAFDPAPGEDNLDEIAPERVGKQLDQWLVGQLSTVYGVAETTAAALVAKGWVLPVLDGLDEMDPAGERPQRAAAVLRALNHPTSMGLRPVVVTSRTERYAQVIGHLDLSDEDAAAQVSDGIGGESVVVQDATVVSIEPLSVPDVLAYLTYRFPDPADSQRCEQRWRPVIDRLSVDHDGDPLVTALRSPLRLFLAVTGYCRPDSDPLVLTRYTTATELDDHLFGLLIPAVTTHHRRHSGGHYQASDVQRWLSTLAGYLRREDLAGRSGSDLRLDEMWRVARGHAPRYLAAAALTTACAAVLTVGVAQVGLSYDALTAVAVVGGALLVTGSAKGSLSHSVTLQRVDFSALRTAAGRRRLAIGLGIGLSFWLGIGLAVGPALGFARGLKVGLPLGLAAGLALGLAFGLQVRPTAIERPRRLVSEGLGHLTTMLAIGLALGFAGGFALGLSVGLPVGLTVVPTLGLVFGLWLVRRSPWPRYAVACRLLARRRELPPRPAVFLDWAYDAGLVRLSGIAVQFRHREFQDWLTTTDREPEPPAPPPSPPSPAGAGALVR